MSFVYIHGMDRVTSVWLKEAEVGRLCRGEVELAQGVGKNWDLVTLRRVFNRS